MLLAHRYSTIVITLENITVVLETSGSRMVQQVHVFAGEVLVQLQDSEQTNRPEAKTTTRLVIQAQQNFECAPAISMPQVCCTVATVHLSTAYKVLSTKQFVATSTLPLPASFHLLDRLERL